MDDTMRDPAVVFIGDHDLPPHMSDAYQFWLAKHDSDTLPHQDVLDPVLMSPSLLPWLCLMEPLDEGRDFLLRLVGTGVVSAAKIDLTNYKASELRDSERPIQRLRWCTENGKPYLSSNPLTWVNGRDHIDYHVLVLPFRGDDVRVSRLLMAFAFDTTTERRT